MLNETDLEALSPDFLLWLNEVEVYSTRYERLRETFEHLDDNTWEQLLSWLYAAYLIGSSKGG